MKNIQKRIGIKMKSNNIKKALMKQGHRFIGEHGSVKICRWTAKSLVDQGICYKEKFYGIKSHRCCMMSPWLACGNKCLHCWRPIEFDFSEVVKGEKEILEPNKIIDKCIKEQRKLLTGFKGNKKINMKKFREAQEPNQFAISLIGEPLLYPKIGELIVELSKRGKTSFVVSNGLCPSVLRKLSRSRQLPTQLYISMNAPNENMFMKWNNPSVKNAWKKYNESLKIMSKLDCRTVIRMTLVKGLNMDHRMIKDYVKLIKKSECDFIEVKGFVSVGFSRKRLGYDMMPSHKEVVSFAEKLVEKLGKDYKILDEHEASKVVLVGKDGKKKEI